MKDNTAVQNALHSSVLTTPGEERCTSIFRETLIQSYLFDLLIRHPPILTRESEQQGRKI